jgi:hypothetical protein
MVSASGVYKRTPEALKEHAVLFWPRELSSGSPENEALSLLLETQDKFLGILLVADRKPTSWKQAVESSSLSPNLFLKHLAILSDVGGEILKRLTPLKGSPSQMTFEWRGESYNYCFQCVHKERVDNAKLGIKLREVLHEKPFDGSMEDIAMILLFGGLSTNLSLKEEIAAKCSLGLLLGDRDAIERFVRSKYILVSQLTKGASANALGQAAQKVVIEKLQNQLSVHGWEFTLNGKIPNISQTGDSRLTTFDIVAKSPSGKYIAIEVSFQVTTNSTIERKAGQAHERFQKLHDAGHCIAYVIDGAGNFERHSALKTICEHSDCTVAFSDTELRLLIDFLRSREGSEDGTLERRSR